MAIDLAEIRHTGAQIVDAIARQFYDEVEYVTAFKPLALEPAAQRAMLCSRLRGQRHLLLLDHADVAASEAWDAVAGLLADLAGGKTLVLLVERGSFPQLRGHSLHHNQFALPPLDEESAALLAGNILACNGAAALPQRSGTGAPAGALPRPSGEPDLVGGATGWSLSWRRTRRTGCRRSRAGECARHRRRNRN